MLRGVEQLGKTRPGLRDGIASHAYIVQHRAVLRFWRDFILKAPEDGCKALFLGLESISQESLEATNKGHNRVDDYRRLIALLHRQGIAVHLGIMFGFDQDDVGIFRRTAEFLDEACVDVATVSMVVPMPGTPTFRRLNADGRILTTDWSRYDGKKHCVFQPAPMSPAELEAGTEWVARRFYSPGSIVRRLAGSRAGIWWNLPRNVGYLLAGLSNAGRSWDPAERERHEGAVPLTAGTTGGQP